jgi:hypothetical protein
MLSILIAEMIELLNILHITITLVKEEITPLSMLKVAVYTHILNP